MSGPDEVATQAIYAIAEELGVKVNPVLVAQLAGFLVGVLTGDEWGEARQAGLSRAAAVRDVATAEAAAQERNK